MYKFQVQYKTNSKTHTFDMHSDSYQKVRDLALNLVEGEITEIRRYVHEDDKKIEDDGDYDKAITFKVFDNLNNFKSIKIPKIRKSLNDNEAYNLAKTYLKINNLTPNKITFSKHF